LAMNVNDDWGRKWLRSGPGRDWLESHDMPRNPFFAPKRECSSSDPRPVLEFTNLNDSSVITETSFAIHGIIDVKNGGFSGWRLEYGAGTDPNQWNILAQGTNAFPNSSAIHTWNLQGIDQNKVTLRLYLSNGEDFYAERRVIVTLNLPTPTPANTDTPTPFPPTDVPTNTPVPPTPTDTATPTEFPTEPPATEAP